MSAKLEQRISYRSKWWGIAEDWNSIGATVKRDEVPTLIAHYVGDKDVTLEERLVFNAYQVQCADHLRPAIKGIVHHADAEFGLLGFDLEV